MPPTFSRPVQVIHGVRLYALNCTFASPMESLRPNCFPFFTLQGETVTMRRIQGESLPDFARKRFRPDLLKTLRQGIPELAVTSTLLCPSGSPSIGGPVFIRRPAEALNSMLGSHDLLFDDCLPTSALAIVRSRCARGYRPRHDIFRELLGSESRLRDVGKRYITAKGSLIPPAYAAER